MSMCGSYVQLPMAELEEVLGDPDSVMGVMFSEEPDSSGREFDIDKAWHAIHFLLNGDPWDGEPPLLDAVLGGTELGDDQGHGPARYLVPAEVVLVANALRGISAEALWSRFSEAKFAEAKIYPEGWSANDDDKNYVLGHYVKLQEFFDKAEAAGHAMILCLT